MKYCMRFIGNLTIFFPNFVSMNLICPSVTTLSQNDLFENVNADS